MKKKSYKIADVKSIRSADLKTGLGASRRAVFGIDVAKSEVVVSVGGDDGKSIVVFKAKQPAELSQLLDIATELQTGGYQVELAAESTGTYSDVLVDQARRRKLPVYRVSTKFVHDAKEIHDGVPSKHDAKDATLILWLHVQGKSRPWLQQEEAQRRAKAVVSRREIHVHGYVANAARLEALLARHWPELLALGATIGILLLKLLIQFPSPQRITANVEEAKRILHRHPSGDKMTALVASARTSQGVVMIEEEELVISELTKQMLAQRREIERIDKELRVLLLLDPVAVRLAALVGPTTAMVLAADLGDLSTYAHARALEKACGLNLRENSSGGMKSGLHITKRGPSRVRQYLYLAAIRLLKDNPIVRAWYASRVARGQHKMCAIVAVLRKLVRSLFHVARGEEFQASKLFDVRRLNLEKDAEVEVEPTLAEALQLDETSVSETTQAAAEPVASAPEEKPQASPPVPRTARVAGKNGRARSPSKPVPLHANAPRIELAKPSDGGAKAASAASQDTASEGAVTGRSPDRAAHEETAIVPRGGRTGRPAATQFIERALP